jgi:hypothetical protein
MNMSHSYDAFSELETKAREIRIREKKRLREDFRLAEAELKDLEETVMEPLDYYSQEQA